MLSTTWIVIIVIVVLLVIAVLLGAFGVRRTIDAYSATLIPITGEVGTTLPSGTFRGVLAGDNFAYTLQLRGLPSPPTEVSIHDGISCAVAGPVLIDLPLPNFSSVNFERNGDPFLVNQTNNIKLTPLIIDLLKNESLTIRVNTVDNPEGLICGRLNKSL
ncbi:hypothetical protein pv_160 [Pithovirus sibericum]|uniref:CHRD domain-containing protein n=1 Tax=Pithovirus sibericum TaxID=1450746 RepID=W5S600_9VIRU|nr:hypothetical protein pv_160 [Pithovirus sibericum]AHH01727.1 hypothetical protein pv_160 [Pithovirus sibericum]WIL05298.1 hypothetical protein pmam_259 [Pithovirus mammoth]